MASNEVDFTKMKVNELKQELKKRGLSTDGKKVDLLERLQTHVGDSALLDDTHDDLLDDAELSDGALDDAPIDTPPEHVTSGKRPSEGEEKRHPKKIILNRKTIEAPDPGPTAETVVESAPPPAKTEVTVRTVKTQQERLQLRASRFGTSDNKVAESAKPAAVTLPNAPANLDVLKKRAERFGTIAPILEKVKVEEKKIERLKRFGESSINPKTAITIDDKKALRAARFASS